MYMPIITSILDYYNTQYSGLYGTGLYRTEQTKATKCKHKS